MNEYKVKLEELLPVIEECLDTGRSFTFSPNGVSMLPMLRQGRDTVTLSPLPERLRKYDLPLYRRPDGKFILHRIVGTAADGSYVCIGDHQFVFETGVKPDWMIAVVTKFTRDGREHSVREWTYRLYCRIWHYSRTPRRILQKIRSGFGRLFAADKTHTTLS